MRRKSYWTTKPTEWAWLGSLGLLCFSLPTPTDIGGSILVVIAWAAFAMLCQQECKLITQCFNEAEFKSKFHLEDLIHCGRITRLCAVLTGANAAGVVASVASAAIAGLTSTNSIALGAQAVLTFAIACWMALTSDKIRTLIDSYPFLKQRGVRNVK